MRQRILGPIDQEIDVTRNVDYSPQEPSTEPISLPKSQRRNGREIQNLLKQCAAGKTDSKTFSKLVPPQRNRYNSLTTRQNKNNKGGF